MKTVTPLQVAKTFFKGGVRFHYVYNSENSKLAFQRDLDSFLVDIEKGGSWRHKALDSWIGFQEKEAWIRGICNPRSNILLFDEEPSDFEFDELVRPHLVLNNEIQDWIKPIGAYILCGQ